ncbi:Fe-S oxidoreductase [Halogeometricum rufum]|uniref:Fe-S oxidoreductase n=1 Tax=Halogeometricum rufum TaxID=553469 RepID=A0A1I6G0U9_9EURY|nr:(Fe-S)-binding protein [Halogeometricum rufum]SFR35687.1 Fe-S oxidoreductase [Halogeometricum rufum]
MILLQSEPTRETFWTISPVGKAVFYALAAMAVLVFLYGVYERFARYARGEADAFERLDDLPGRVRRASRVVLSNEKQFDRDLYGGVMHAFILWGFLTLLIGTTILGFDIDVYRTLTGTSFFTGDFYLSYSFVMDALGFLFVVGVGMAIYRRYVVREERLWGKHTGFEDDAFVWTLFVLGVGGYVLEALRIVGTEFPEWETVSFVGYFVALVFDAAGMSAETATLLYWPGWWSHAILALGFVAFVPYAKPFHMISSFANVVTADEKAGKRLPGVPPDEGPEEIGYTSIEDLSWRQLLDTDACTKCGRCSSVCPAKASGRPLDPRDVILDLKSYRESLDAGETEEIDIVADGGTSVVDSSTMESCMACMACMDACPVDIEHLSHFTEMNRRLTETGQMQEPVQEAMMNIFQNGNAFGDPARKRPDWTRDLDFEVPDAREEDVEFLWYVGDYPSYDERNRRVARSLARLFELAGVSYGILYEDEQHDGNDVRRVGEEGLYEMLVEDNADAVHDCEFDKIVCTDPHSYNTFLNEYPEMDPDFDYPVYHYTQVVESLVRDGRVGLDGTEIGYTVTYHDPCHLGRFNDEYEAPRELVRATGATLAEMPRNRSDSFCCGGGGGGLWMEHEEEEKPSEERLREALEDTEAGAAVEKFVVACPMCATMYEDGRKTGDYEDDIEIIDVAELLVEALESKRGTAVGADDGTTPATAD